MPSGTLFTGNSKGGSADTLAVEATDTVLGTVLRPLAIADFSFSKDIFLRAIKAYWRSSDAVFKCSGRQNIALISAYRSLSTQISPARSSHCRCIEAEWGARQTIPSINIAKLE